MRTLEREVLWVYCIVSLLSLAGCDRSNVSGLQAGGLAVPGMLATQSLEAPRREGNTLAYEHHITIELDAAVVPSRLEALRAACAADRENSCTILTLSAQQQYGVPNGTIRMRLVPAGVDELVVLAQQGGKMLARNTNAEDLAQPIADTERQLALLTLHRDRLSEFAKRRDIAVEQLITVSKELAAVQTQIEQLSGERANLRRRVETEVLTIQLQAPYLQIHAQQTVVRDALRNFGSNFRAAIAGVITFLAYLVPWLIVIVPGLILLRWLWRTIGRWLKRRDRASNVPHAQDSETAT